MTEIACRGPYDLALSIRAARSFARRGRPGSSARADVMEHVEPVPETLRLGVWLAGRPTLLEIRQTRLDPPVVDVETDPSAPTPGAEFLAAHVVNAAMELEPFYRLAADHPLMGRLTRELHGLKPFRPASLFDMLIMAVTEQQISLLAAQRIQARLVERFGTEVKGAPVFPAPSTLAEASLDDLLGCGLSHRKAEYIVGAARAVTEGALDLEALETASEDEVRSRISALRGFGSWSADYVLIRGMGRADVVPWDDLGVRTTLGQLLGAGRRFTQSEAQAALASFEPYRGLATFYALVGSRIERGAT